MNDFYYLLEIVHLTILSIHVYVQINQHFYATGHGFGHFASTEI